MRKAIDEARERETEVLENRAKLNYHGIVAHSDCEECMEEYIFQMQDKHYAFSIGLTKILLQITVHEAAYGKRWPLFYCNKKKEKRGGTL